MCVDKMAVGNTLQVTTQALTIGSVTVREHFPTQETSLIASTRMILPPCVEKIDKSIIKFLLFFVKRIKIERVKKIASVSIVLLVLIVVVLVAYFTTGVVIDNSYKTEDIFETEETTVSVAESTTQEVSRYSEEEIRELGSEKEGFLSTETGGKESCKYLGFRD